MVAQVVIGPRPTTGAAGTMQLCDADNAEVASVAAAEVGGAGSGQCSGTFTDVPTGWYRYEYKDSLSVVRSRGGWVYITLTAGTYYVDDPRVPMTNGLSLDSYAEPTAVPAASSSLKDKIGWLFMLSRNKVLQTSSLQTVKADDQTTTVATAPVADDGVTASRGEFS